MASVTEVRPDGRSAEGGFVLREAGWDDYEAMLRIVGERRVRVTYDRGEMEVAVPSQKHERTAQLLGLLVTRLAEELQIPYEPLGMTTWRRASAGRGLEADQCYYIEHHAVVREKETLDLEVDPPPDLAIEVDVTSSSLDRLGIYAGLGVPEVWRCDGEAVTFLRLGGDGRYEAAETSRSFPHLRPVDVNRFLELARTTDKVRWAHELRDWAGGEYARRAGGSEPQ